MPLILDLSEVDVADIDAADVVVIGGLVVDLAIGQIDGRCPLCGTGDVGALTRLVQSGENYFKRLKNGEFECAIMSVSSDSDTPSSVLNKFIKDSPFNYAKANIDGYSEILSSTVTQETVNSMANRYFEAERAVCSNGNFVPLYYQTEYFVWQKNINNIIFDQGSKQCYYRYAYKN